MSNQNLKDVLEQATITLIEKSVAGIDTAVSFLSAEIPDVIKQLLTWNFTVSVIWAFIGLILLGAVVWLWRWAVKKEEGDPDAVSFTLFMTCVLGLPGAWMFLENILEAVKIWVAPKIWLIEYAAELTRKFSH